MDVRDKAILAGQAANSMLWDRNRPWSATIQLGFVYDLALAAPDGPAVECGVYHGGSVICWAQARVRRGRIIVNDNWASKCEARCRANLAKFNVNAEVITANSWEVPAILGVPIAFCFIDSDHGVAGIPNDIVVWPDAMMPGGILAFHDYGVWKSNVMVQRVVDKWQAKAKWINMGLVGSLIAFRKPK